MTTNKKEAQARILINKMLENAGWRFFDNEQGKANIQLEPNIKITQKDIDSHGNDFEKIKDGYIDYLLLDKDGFPLVVLEAKRENADPLEGKEQARNYAKEVKARFVVLSNGSLHYFWDRERGNPEVIISFPTLESLEHRQKFKPNPSKLFEETCDENYIVRTQKPEVLRDPSWSNTEYKKELIEKDGLRVLRPYQLQAIKALQKFAKNENDRFLFEMATGTGKTLLSAAIIKLFLRTGNAKRILFLVDRLELEEQAHKNFTEYLKNDYTSVIYKKNKTDWKKAEIVVSTIQSLVRGSKYKNYFSPTDFDLLISDEAHRSIGGNNRAVFEYFIGYKLGLTATPKDYLKNVDINDFSPANQRSWERRQILDTYKTFGCADSNPTFRYSLMNGVKENYLINPTTVDARTEITTEMLSEQGYTFMVEDEEGEETEQTVFKRDFEKKFFSNQTNTVFCESFLKNALRDPISEEIGKSIIFCVSQNHASKITQILNKMAHNLWPNKYNSNFAVQVTSSIPSAQQFTVQFANNRLSGRSKFLNDYRTSKTRVCVTVGMMTTGYDCQDILNLCLMRPVFSPTDFVQMKGRGTRKFTFKYRDENSQEHIHEKNNFKLFDFFANCEYFETEFNYDEELPLPQSGGAEDGGSGRPQPPIEEFVIQDPDAIKTISEGGIPEDGMRIDREFWGTVEEVIYQDQDIKSNFENGNTDRAVDLLRDKYENKPKLYLTLTKIMQKEGLDWRLSWRDVLERIFNNEPFKTKEELLEDECEKFISIYKPESKYIPHIKNYLKAYATDAEFKNIIDERHYGDLNHCSVFSMEDFKALNGDTIWQTKIPEYAEDYIKNKYMVG